MGWGFSYLVRNVGGLKILSPGLEWVVGDGYMTRFWIDCWLGSGYLKDASLQPIPSNMLGDRACDYWLSHVGWRLELLQAFLRCYVLVYLQWYLLAVEEDSPKFELSISGKFISKEVYDLLPRDGLEEAGWQ